jgi:hypothetical protein
LAPAVKGAAERLDGAAALQPLIHDRVVEVDVAL